MIAWMHKVFAACVKIMMVFSHVTGIGYKEINVIIFCIIEPIIFFIMCYIIWKQSKLLKQKEVNNAHV